MVKKANKLNKSTTPSKTNSKTSKVNGNAKTSTTNKKNASSVKAEKKTVSPKVAPAPVFQAFGHISINVDNLEEASQHYFELFGAKPFQKFPRYNSKECALGQGFLDGKLDMDICHLMIPNINIMIELFKYNTPKMEKVDFVKKPYQQGFVSHCAMRVPDVCKEYERLKTIKGVRLMNDTPGFTPRPLGAFPFEKMIIPDPEKDNMEYKRKLMKVFSGIKFLYFVDKYNLQWELEQSTY